MTQGEERYGIVIGGIHRTDNGQVDASIAPISVYSGLTYEQIQAFWKWIMTTPGVQLAMQQFADAMAAELAKLGDEFGVSSGKATAESLKSVQVPPKSE